MSIYIQDEIAEKIKEVAKIDDIIRDFVEMKPTGSTLTGDCPIMSCRAKKKFNYHPTKGIFKCWACEEGGNTAISFLTKTQGMTYREALEYLADRYSISLQEDNNVKKTRSNRKESFRDSQLKESGISDNYQKYYQTKNETAYEFDRYQKATINTSWDIIEGDDMILHYVNFDYSPMMYKNFRGKQVPLIRARWANPALHLDKSGKAIKYQSPYKSGSQLWLPNGLIKAYDTFEIFDTLYITEGEKKADKMCLEGMMTVGIMGINNFAADGDMPHQFETLVKRCGISKIVFLLDADWQEIAITADKPIDQRPKNFFRAVDKFQKYFQAYAAEGIYLSLFFGYGKDKALKGVDDLLVRQLSGKEPELKADFEKAMLDRKGEGTYINVVNITTLSSYQLQEFWSLHSKPAFLNTHKESLKGLFEFTFGKLKYRYNKEGDEFELAQKMLPYEQFWNIKQWEDKSGNAQKRIEFNYRNSRFFLQNRGYYNYEAVGENYRFVHIENKLVTEIDHNIIQDFVIDFAEELQEYDVVELLLRGGKQYLGPDKLSKMFKKQPQFIEPEKNAQYLYFKNCYWQITADEIKQRPLSELPGYVWKDQIIDFEASLLSKPIATVGRKKDRLHIELSDEAHTSDIVKYFTRTSWFSWQKKQELKKNEDGKFQYVAREIPESETKEDAALTSINLIGKMLAAGYVLHDYIDWSNTKAIICMDGLESEVGKSQGGTGKSIWGKMFRYMVPQVVIDGKQKNIEDNNNIYEDVDERTKVIFFDDVRVNFNFEWLFSQITTQMTVNAKYIKTFKIDPRKFIIATNHALKGDDDSHERRQYIISFSNYYNNHRTVFDDMGRQMFHEWDKKQWNLYYNWMATCSQAYLKYGLKYKVPQGALKKRKLRQEIGENFLEFATLYFHQFVDDDGKKGKMLNNRIEFSYLFEKYLQKYPAERRWMNGKKFKDAIKKYSKYAALKYNLPKEGQRIMSNSKEYIILSDEDFDITDFLTIDSDNQLNSYS